MATYTRGYETEPFRTRADTAAAFPQTASVTRPLPAFALSSFKLRSSFHEILSRSRPTRSAVGRGRELKSGELDEAISTAHQGKTMRRSRLGCARQTAEAPKASAGNLYSAPAYREWGSASRAPERLTGSARRTGRTRPGRHRLSVCFGRTTRCHAAPPSRAPSAAFTPLEPARSPTARPRFGRFSPSLPGACRQTRRAALGPCAGPSRPCLEGPNPPHLSHLLLPTILQRTPVCGRRRVCADVQRAP